MTKTQMTAQVKDLITSRFDGKKTIKIEELMALLDEYSKASSRKKLPQPKEIDGQLHRYCRYYEEYFPEEEMVKGKNYSKKAISLWTKARSLSNKLLRLMFIDEDNKELKELLKVLNEYNNPEVYKDGSLEEAITKAQAL